MNHRAIEWIGVFIVLVIVILVLFGCTTTPIETEKPDPLYWIQYKEITGRNLDGELVTVKIPTGYRVCECVSKLDSVEFECGECELYN